MATTERDLDAAEAISCQLHGRPWLGNPAAVYSGCGDLSSIVCRLPEVLDQAIAAVAQATGSDAGDLAGWTGNAVKHFAEAKAALHAANTSLLAAWSAVGHLEFPPGPSDG